MSTILFITANPLDTPKIDAENEVRIVRDSVSRSIFRVELIPAARVGDFQRSLIETQPVIVHWSGHGMRRTRAGADEDRDRDLSPSEEEQERGSLVVQDEHGNAESVPTQALADLFRILRDDIPTRCVVLNACFTEDQAAAIAEHVDFVIGTTRAIPDEAAITFSKQFYYALAEGRSLMTAFELGRNAVALSGGDPSVLKSWSRPGVDPKQVRLREHSPSTPPPPSAPPPRPAEPAKHAPSSLPHGKLLPFVAGGGAAAVLGLVIYIVAGLKTPRPDDVDAGKGGAGSTSSISASSSSSSSSSASSSSASSSGAFVDSGIDSGVDSGVDAQPPCPALCCGGVDCKTHGPAMAVAGTTQNACPSGRSCVRHACDYDLPEEKEYLVRVATFIPSKPGEVIPKDAEICMRRGSHPDEKWTCVPHQAVVDVNQRSLLDANRLPISMKELITTGVDFTIRFNQRVVGTRTDALVGRYIHAKALCVGLRYRNIGSYSVIVHLDDAR